MVRSAAEVARGTRQALGAHADASHARIPVHCRSLVGRPALFAPQIFAVRGQPMADEESLCFYDQNFLAAQPLCAANVMEYFATSQFYDRGCVNEILRMQSQFASIDIQHRLTTTPGFYYVLEEEADELFVIAKKEFDGHGTSMLKAYYCMHGHIYCAPTARAVSEARIIDGLWQLNEALDQYEALKRYGWQHGPLFREEQRPLEDTATEINFVLEALHDFEKMLDRKAAKQ